MILALDVGNTQIYGGVIKNEEVIFGFRRSSKTGASSDEIGIFLRTVLRENNIDYKEVREIVACSVVPADNHSLASACVKYFDISPYFLEASKNTGLKNKYDNPNEVGADRIANAIAATKLYPNQDLIIIDLGTATTFCAIKADKTYMGGVIIAGIRLSNEALGQKAAKLSNVEIRKCESVLGTNTVSSMQTGLYFGHLGAMELIIKKLTDECFNGKKPMIIGTGGVSSLFEGSEIFDEINSELVLWGLVEALKIKD